MTKRFWIWVFGDRLGLDWVLAGDTMAFPTRRYGYVRDHLAIGDEAVLYAAGRMGKSGMALCAHVKVTGSAELGEGPPIQAGRFRTLVPIEHLLLLEEHNWVPIKPLVPVLEFLPDDKSWGWPLQLSPLEVSQRDFETMVSALHQSTGR